MTDPREVAADPGSLGPDVPAPGDAGVDDDIRRAEAHGYDKGDDAEPPEGRTAPGAPLGPPD